MGNGNVGIGTTTPAAKLTVNSQVQNVIANFASSSASNSWIGVQNNTSQVNLGIASQPSTLGYAYIWSSGGKFMIGNDGNPTFVVDGMGNGNVGIGTATPDAKLTVKGAIHTQEVRVDLLGAVAPDFVFEPSYNLRTLAETERYIKEHKHLPEIPSAAEMEANGMELKAMNLKLLQKVEELTLYTIEQQKLIEKLTNRIEKLETTKN